MTGFEHVVVAIGAAESDRPLIAYAAFLARVGHTREIRFVHVADSAADAGALRDTMRAVVAEYFAELPIRTECDVLHGPLTDRLLAYLTEFQADLAIIGARKHKLGARLAMVAPCSVAIIPAEAPPVLRHLLVAFDLSESAVDTLRWATQLLVEPDIRCTALHVVTPESADLFDATGDTTEATVRMRGILDQVNEHGVEITPRLVGVTRTADVGRSHPFSFAASIQGIDVAQTILAEAEWLRADCIAMSTRGRSASASILLGSVTEKVIERSPVPLLVRKETARRLGLADILLGQTARGVIKTN